MQDQGVPIRDLSLGEVVWMLQGLEHIWDIPPEHLKGAALFIERLKIELVIRSIVPN